MATSRQPFSYIKGGGRKPMEKIVPKLGLDIQKDKEKRKSTLPHKHTHRLTHAHPPHTV